MSVSGKFKNCVQIVGMMAVLVAVTFFPPVSAHAGMVHAGQGDHQTDLMDHADAADMSDHTNSFGTLDHGDHSLETQATCHTDQPDTGQPDTGKTAPTQSHDGGTQCCSVMCFSTIMQEHAQSSNDFMRDDHVSLPIHTLASVDVRGFLRPPNL